MSYDEPGRNLSPGDTMSDAAADWIYVHRDSARFVTYQEAREQGTSLAEYEAQEALHQQRVREEAEARRAAFLADLAPLRTFIEEHSDFQAMLNAWHEAHRNACTAYSEGQDCCLDWLLGVNP